MQLSHHILLTLSLFLVLDVHGTKYPRNTAAVEGDAVLLECQPNEGNINDFTWMYHGATTQIITRGKHVEPIFADEVSLIYNYTTLLYDLKLNVSVTGHILQYSSGNNDSRGFADLIVLDAPPSCGVSANLSDLIEGETFNVHCKVAYRSRPKWNAIMECRDNVTGVNQPTGDSGSIDGLVMERQFTIKSTTSLQNHSYSCSIYFPAPPEDNAKRDSERGKYSKEAPTYKFHYHTDRINIYPAPASGKQWSSIAAVSVCIVDVLILAILAACHCHCNKSCNYCCSEHIPLREDH